MLFVFILFGFIPFKCLYRSIPALDFECGVLGLLILVQIVDELVHYLCSIINPIIGLDYKIIIVAGTFNAQDRFFVGCRLTIFLALASRDTGIKQDVTLVVFGKSGDTIVTGSRGKYDNKA